MNSTSDWKDDAVHGMKLLARRCEQREKIKQLIAAKHPALYGAQLVSYDNHKWDWSLSEDGLITISQEFGFMDIVINLNR